MDNVANHIAKTLRAAKRNAAKKAGAFDGRFAPKVEANGKKAASKSACRGKVNWQDLLDEY